MNGKQAKATATRYVIEGKKLFKAGKTEKAGELLVKVQDLKSYTTEQLDTLIYKVGDLDNPDIWYFDKADEKLSSLNERLLNYILQ